QGSKDEDRKAHAALARGDAFLDGRHAESPDESARLRRPSGSGQTVTVCVSLHDEKDARGPHAGADRTEIMRQRRKVHLGPGGSVKIEPGPAHRNAVSSCGSASSASKTLFSKRVYSGMYVSGIVPTGPLRCLRMITSAAFCSVGSSRL